LMTVNAVPDIEADDIGDREYLIDNIEIDTMDFANLLSGLHARLSIVLPETDYPRMISVAGIQKYLAEHGK
jgi:acyl carrier protein